MTRPRLVLRGLGARVEGLHWESETRLRVGRDGSCEVLLNDPSVSREHAEIVHTPQGWMLRDLGSRNGTRLNSVRLGEAALAVRARDLVWVGRVPFEIAVADHDAAPEAPAGPQRQLRGSGACFNLKATTRRSWERAVEQLAHQEERQLPARRMLPLLRAGHHLTQMTSLDELLRTMLEEVVTVLEAQRGAIALADDATGKLRLRAFVAANDHLPIVKKFSETLADRCYLEGESLLCADVRIDDQLVTAQSVSHGMMASIICTLLRSPRRRLGVLHLDRGPYQEPFTKDDFELVDALACFVSVGIESAQMLEQQRELFLRTATALAQTVEMRDEYTGSHTQRVTAYALMLAEELGLSFVERQQIEIGAPLHDIGKIAVADAILRKPGKLSPEEVEQMQTHAAKGATLLGNIPGLGPMLPIIRHHHERWDGSGYPDGLAGEAIPLLARVVAVADAFDAMTSDRPYRRAMPLAEALAELVARAGCHFDPKCVEAFLRLRPRIEQMLAPPAPPAPPPEAATRVLPVARPRPVLPREE